MGVNHSMNHAQVDQVLRQFEATTTAIRGIETKVGRVKGYIQGMQEQRVQLTRSAEAAKSLLDSVSTSLNERSDEVLDYFQQTLEAFAGPVEQLELTLFNLGLQDAPRQLQRELGPLLMPAVVLVVILTVSNTVFGFMLAADDKIARTFSVEGVAGDKASEASASGVNVLNLFAIVHVASLGAAVAYILSERIRVAFNRRRQRQQKGTKGSFWANFTDDWFGEDVPDDGPDGRKSLLSNLFVGPREGGEDAGPWEPSWERLSRAPGLTESPLVEEDRVLAETTEGSLGSPGANLEVGREPHAGDLRACAPAAGLPRDVPAGIRRTPAPASSSSAGPPGHSIEDRPQPPDAAAMLVPARTCLRRPAVVGEQVFARRTVAARDVAGARRAWHLAPGELATVVEVDDDGDFRLANSHDQQSGWVKRGAFLYAEDYVQEAPDAPEGPAATAGAHEGGGALRGALGSTSPSSVGTSAAQASQGGGAAPSRPPGTGRQPHGIALAAAGVFGDSETSGGEQTDSLRPLGQGQGNRRASHDPSPGGNDPSSPGTSRSVATDGLATAGLTPASLPPRTPISSMIRKLQEASEHLVESKRAGGGALAGKLQPLLQLAPPQQAAPPQQPPAAAQAPYGQLLPPQARQQPAPGRFGDVAGAQVPAATLGRPAGLPSAPAAAEGQI